MRASNKCPITLALVAEQGNPRKMENHNDLMGLINLLQGRHAAAVGYYRQADITSNICIRG